MAKHRILSLGLSWLALAGAFQAVAQERPDSAALIAAQVIKYGVLKEVGDRITPGKEPIRFIEMDLKRVGDTDWPAAGAIGPR